LLRTDCSRSTPSSWVGTPTVSDPGVDSVLKSDTGLSAEVWSPGSLPDMVSSPCATSSSDDDRTPILSSEFE